ncbi:MAG TPA: YqgE/AlgH family protein [Mycobacteriales bacterium]|nr:YqgE/AlgH family protein [Mycobacteriales bacterium]
MSDLRPDAGVEPGSLLVASPLLGDPNFARTVIYVLNHRREGTIGVVLNRPSEVTLLDVLPRWSDLASQPRTLFMGGPVDTDTALCLAEVAPGSPGARPERWTPVSAPVGLTDLDGDPTRLNGEFSRLRIFAGYAGWGSGQLADELAEGAWLVVAGHPSDVFTESGANLWRLVLRRQGGRVALLATYPADPRLN